MPVSRRTALQAAALTGLCLALPRCIRGLADTPSQFVDKGNPILPGIGVCDPQVRIYEDQIYLYSTHDASADSKSFKMNDWRVWHSSDLVDWQLVSVLRPEQTYFGKPSTQCWATDAAQRNGKYYLYFSMGPEDIGVVEGSSPAGPWHDPIGKPLIAKGQVETMSRDPGILQEPDGTSYIVFGTFDYFIARLNEDMVSLAETPRKLKVENPEGPYGKGRTDDKPFLHRRGDKYYLSWGCYYGISDSPYGPFDCKGSIITADRLAPEFLDPANHTGAHALPLEYQPKDWLGFDRHASFFTLFGQWYFICNDQALPGSGTFFRNSVVSYVRYKDNGDIDPIRVTAIGVGQYDAASPIEATDFFKAMHARVSESADGRFDVRDLRDGSYLLYPKVHKLGKRSKLTLHASEIDPRGVEVEVRRGTALGKVLGKLTLDRSASGSHSVTLQTHADTEDICLVFKGHGADLLKLNRLEFTES